MTCDTCAPSALNMCSISHGVDPNCEGRIFKPVTPVVSLWQSLMGHFLCAAWMQQHISGELGA